jgi:excisionase family DNA binding protein
MGLHNLTTTTLPQFLSAQQVASLFGVMRRTICLWAEYGELPGFKMRGHWRFRRESIDHWLE